MPSVKKRYILPTRQRQRIMKREMPNLDSRGLHVSEACQNAGNEAFEDNANAFTSEAIERNKTLAPTTGRCLLASASRPFSIGTCTLTGNSSIVIRRTGPVTAETGTQNQRHTAATVRTKEGSPLGLRTRGQHPSRRDFRARRWPGTTAIHQRTTHQRATRL